MIPSATELDHNVTFAISNLGDLEHLKSPHPSHENTVSRYTVSIGCNMRCGQASASHMAGPP